MNIFLRRDQELARKTKPDIVQIENISFEKNDCFVLCAGFEDRVLGGLEMMELKNGGGKVVTIEYLPEIKENKLEEINQFCDSSNLAKIPLEYDRRAPESFGNLLLEKLKNFSGRIFIDISGMSRLLIVQILDAIGRRGNGFENITVIYTEAEIYPPTKSEVEELIKQKIADVWFPITFISSGVFDLEILPELTSISMNSQPYRLIAFPSFNSYQLTTLRSELQISKFTFIHGKPPNTELDWRTKSIRNINNIDEIPDKEEKIVSTLDYRETLDLLLGIYDEVNIFEKIFIAPTGSKMQAVAIGILRAYLSDVQIVYPTPKSFPSTDKYTEGINKIFRLDLGSL